MYAHHHQPASRSMKLLFATLHENFTFFSLFIFYVFSLSFAFRSLGCQRKFNWNYDHAYSKKTKYEETFFSLSRILVKVHSSISVLVPRIKSVTASLTAIDYIVIVVVLLLLLVQFSSIIRCLVVFIAKPYKKRHFFNVQFLSSISCLLQLRIKLCCARNIPHFALSKTTKNQVLRVYTFQQLLHDIINGHKMVIVVREKQKSRQWRRRRRQKKQKS